MQEFVLEDRLPNMFRLLKHGLILRRVLVCNLEVGGELSQVQIDLVLLK